MARGTLARQAILLLISALLAPKLGAWWGQQTTLDEALPEACAQLAGHSALAGKPVLISPVDFYQTGSGMYLPLSAVLREKMITYAIQAGLRVVLPGANEDEVAILQGQWQIGADELSLTFKVNEFGPQGPQVLATAATRVSLDSLPADYLQPDLESWSRYAVHKLEEQLPDRRRRSLHLQPLDVSLGTKPRELGRYLADWLRPALAEARSFVPVDPARRMQELPTEQIRIRAIGHVSNTSVAAKIMDVDAELGGSVYPHDKALEVRLAIRDRGGRQLAAFSVQLPKELIPSVYLATAAESKPAPIPNHSARVSADGLKLSLSADRGDDLARYRVGERIRFIATVNRRAWFYLFNLLPDGSAFLLYPVPGIRSAALDAGTPIVLPEDGIPTGLQVTSADGREGVWAVASEKALDLPQPLRDDWTRTDKLQQRVRTAALAQGGGYAEAELEIETVP